MPSIKHEWTDNTTSLSELNQDRKEIVIMCHKCDFSTSSGQALTKHMKADHSSLTSRKYDRGGTALKGIKKCQICKYEVETEAKLTEHLMTTHMKK